MGAYRIVLDYGHGGIKSGAAYKGIQEKDLNLQLGSRIYDSLHKQSTSDETIKVILTRDTDMDIPIAIRYQLINEFTKDKPIDLVVSIHFNAVSDLPDVNGFEVYYLQGSTKGTPAAKSIIDRVKKNQFKIRGKGYKTTAALGRKLAMIHKTKPPAVLVEAGFLSNEQDRSNSIDSQWQENMAAAISEGVWKYLREQRA